MEEYSGKRAAGGLFVPRKGSTSLTLRDASNSRDQSGQFCNRLGCSGRLKYAQRTKVGFPEKTKVSGPSLRPSTGKEIIGSSSRTSSFITNGRTSYLNSKRKLSSQHKIYRSDTSVSSESEASDIISSPSRVETENYLEYRGARSGKGALMEIGSSSVTSKTRARKTSIARSGPYNENSSLAASGPSLSKGSGPGTRNGTNGSGYRLRNLKCNSISDVLPQGSSSSESNSSRSDASNKSNAEGKSSLSSRGKKMAAGDGHVSSSTSGIAASNSSHNRIWANREDGAVAASVRTRRSTNVCSRIRLSNQHNGNALSIAEPAAAISQFSEPQLQRSRPSLRHFSGDAHSQSSSFSLSSSNGDSLTSLMPFTSSHFMNPDALQRYNMNGIAEVLLALERIEQDDELTHEQVLALETSLFLSGLNLHDQHRDMRMDIDNMSYEELLALGERIGSVSTALSEEELSKCLKRCVYQGTPSEVGVGGSGEDEHDIKCSICQDEYVYGDEIGKLVCEHQYHVTCIDQWLRLKNWCPICKASAAPSKT